MYSNKDNNVIAFIDNSRFTGVACFTSFALFITPSRSKSGQLSFFATDMKNEKSVRSHVHFLTARVDIPIPFNSQNRKKNCYNLCTVGILVGSLNFKKSDSFIPAYHCTVILNYKYYFSRVYTSPSSTTSSSILSETDCLNSSLLT